MIKLSDFPDGTIVETDDDLFKKEGYRWANLDGSGRGTPYFTLIEMNSRQISGNVAIVGIPYPVALKLAEWLGGTYPKRLGARSPEELILEAGKEI